MLLLFFCNACPGNCTIIPTACQWWQSRSCNQDHYICLSPDRLPGQYPISAGDPCAKDEGKHSWRWNGENWTTQISKLFAESWQRLQNGPTGLSHPHAHLLFALDVFFKFFFLFCHAFRFHLDKYSGGPTGTAWGMARTFQLEGIISWIRNFMGTPYVILAILPHPRCMLDPIFWCLSDSSALFTQQCATAEALRNLAEEWGSQTEKKRENIQGSRGHVFFPSSFLWTTFHIYIYKHVNVLSMHHTSLSLYVFIYIYSTCYISIKSSFSHYRYSEIILNLWMDARTRNAFFDQLQQAWKCQARLIRFCPCSRRSFIGWSWASFLVCQCVSQHMGYFVVRSGQWNN